VAASAGCRNGAALPRREEGGRLNTEVAQNQIERPIGGGGRRRNGCRRCSRGGKHVRNGCWARISQADYGGRISQFRFPEPAARPGRTGRDMPAPVRRGGATAVAALPGQRAAALGGLAPRASVARASAASRSAAFLPFRAGCGRGRNEVADAHPLGQEERHDQEEGKQLATHKISFGTRANGYLRNKPSDRESQWSGNRPRHGWWPIPLPWRGCEGRIGNPSHDLRFSPPVT
jgi:hypothetical protein